MRLVLGLAAGAVALCGCNWMERGKPASKFDRAKAQQEQVRRACASKLTYARLKEYVFDEAERIRHSDPRRLDSIAAYAVVRMEHPVVKSRDDDLNITVCSGRLIVDLPPGIQDAFDGQSVIKADVEYAAQAAVDGSGLVYSMSGAEPIIYRIATLGLPARPLPQIAAAPAAPAAARPVETRVAEAPPKVQPPAPAKTRVPARPAVRAPAEPQRPAIALAKPSFNCRYARTRSERMICQSGSLAAADRRMSAAYYSEMAGAPRDAKRALRRSRDSFLARRERCPNEACVARVYAERIAEIRRLAGR